MNCKKLLCLLCVLVFCFAALSPAYAEQSEAPGEEPGLTPTNWMSYLYDELYMHQINIPGTHDSGTKHASPGQCQNIPINEQLDMGVRFLDMRLGVRWKMVDGRKQHWLQIYHGSIDCYLSFDEVLDWCSSFLAAHPSEFIVMSAKEDPDPQRGSEYNTAQMMEQYIAKYNAKHPGLFYTENRIPQVKEVRGKIVLVRRYSNGSCTPIGIDARSHWPNDSYGMYENVTHYRKDDGTSVSIRLGVQDCYSFGSGGSGCEAEKWYCWRKWRGKAEEDELPSSKWANRTLWINFGSGCNKLGLAINAIADYVNPRIKSSFRSLWNTGQIRGIIPMDFVTLDVVRTVYESNVLLRSRQQPPSVYGVNETIAGRNDGKLRLTFGYTNTGLIQYRLSGTATPDAWRNWPSDVNTIEGLAPGIYDLRNKENEEYMESDTVQAVVGPGSVQTYLVAVTKLVSSPDATTPFAPLTYRYKTPSSVTYTLTNVGNSPVTNLSVWLTGDTNDFEFTPVTQTSLAVDASIDVHVKFLPARSAGEYACALQCSYSNMTYSAIPLVNILQVVEPFNLGTDGAQMSAIAAKLYTGNPITPPFTVEVPANNQHDSYILIKDKDFTAGYFDNTKVGTAYATAYGKGNFVGALTTEFEITGYTVTLDANGGTIEGGDTKVFQNRSDIPPLEDNVPYRSGYAFNGWYYDNGTPAKTYDQIQADTILSAKWVSGDYTVSVDPAKKDFGSMIYGYTTPPDAQSFTLKNTGISTITGFSVTGATDDFSIAYTSVSIAPDRTATFTVQPKAGLDAGVYADTITVFTAHSTSGALTLPVTFTVQPCPIAVTPEETDFGVAAPGYPSPPAAQTFYITYTGDGAIDLQQPAGAAHYDISTLSATTLDTDNTTATFTVRPKASLPEGVYYETISITGESRANTLLGKLFAPVQRVLSTNNAVTVSASVMFTVSSSIAAPEITVQPADVTVSAGSTATFTIEATGNPTPSYQWQQWDKANQLWIDLPCVESTYTTENLSAEQHGTQFRCRVWNYTSQENVMYSDIVTVSVNSLTITPAGGFVVGNAPADLTLHIGEDGHIPSTGDFGSLAIAREGEIGATPVDARNYDVTFGSIHLTLHQDWLNTLPVGMHTLQVTLAGNYANTPVLTIPLVITTPGGSSSADVPMTGDSARPWLWFGMILLSSVGLVASAAGHRRKRKVD